MPSGPLAHICLMVKDLDQAIADWRKILGVLDPEQLAEPLVRYDDFEGGEDQMRWVTFVAAHGAEIQLVEPAPDRRARVAREVAGGDRQRRRRRGMKAAGMNAAV